MAVEVISCEKLSNKYETRYIIVDNETGEVLDDAQGYGYKTKQKAHAAYAYKTRDCSKDKIKEQKKAAVKEWCRNHRAFVRILEDTAFEIAKGSWGPEDKFDVKLVAQVFKENGFNELPFTVAEFLRYWGG